MIKALVTECPTTKQEVIITACSWYATTNDIDDGFDSSISIWVSYDCTCGKTHEFYLRDD